MSERGIDVGRDAQGNVFITGDNNRSRVVIIQQRVVEAAVAPPPPGRLGPNPYNGLAAFGEQDADRFFGRGELIDKLWKQFRDHQKPGALRLLPILGPSSSGKSSLARAGLVPELAARPLPALASPRVGIMVPGVRPLEALATVLARVATNDPAPAAKTREFRDELARPAGDGRFDGLRRIADTLPGIDSARLVLLVDQFEETYQLCPDEAERDAFVATLLDAAGDAAARVSVVLTLRSDFLGATIRHPALNQAISAQGFIVPGMSADELREAIGEPAKRAGHPLDKGTIQLLVEQTVGRDGALPLLQFALTRIWDGLGDGKPAADTLKELGGVGGALAKEAEETFAGLDEADQPIARRAFLAMVQLGEGSADSRRRVSLDEIVAGDEPPERVLAVLRRFALPDKRLISLEGESEAVGAEVTHEMLIQRWPTLQKWLESERADIRYHRRLAEAVDAWDEAGRPKGSLYRPPDLDNLQSFVARKRADMRAVETAFLVESELAWLEEASAKERDRRERQRLLERQVETELAGKLAIKRWLKGAVALAFGLLVASLGALGFWWHAQAETQRAEKAAAEALAALADAREKEVRYLTTAAERELANGPPTSAMLLALEALPEKPGDPYFAGAERVLWDALQANRERAVLHGHEDWIRAVAWGPEGRLASASDDKTVRVWDPAAGEQPLAVLRGHEGAALAVAWGPEGRLASASSDRTVRVWDPAKPDQPLAVLRGHEGAVWAVAWGPEGRLASASDDKTVRVWDPAKPDQPLAVLRGHEDWIRAVAWGPEGRLASASGDGTVRVWDPAKPDQPLAVLRGHEDWIRAVAWGPEGRLASAPDDNTVRVWDPAGGDQPLAVLRGHEEAVRAVAWGPEGRLASASSDRTVRVWEGASSTDALVRTAKAALRIGHKEFWPEERARFYLAD